MLGDDVKDFQLNDETIKYIIDNVLYNRKKDIASEIDTDKVNFMHKIYNNLYWYRHYDENGNEKKHIVLPIQMVIDFTLILLVCKYFTTIMRIRISLQRRNFWKSKIFFFQR